MPPIDDILDRIHARPALYTGENTLTSIDQFLSGYSFALMSHDISTDHDPLILPREFHDWVAYRLHFDEATSGWCNMICKRANSDQQAIDRFFQLLAEFKDRTPHTVARLTGFARTYRKSSTYRNSDGDVIQSPYATLNYPESISLVTYTDDQGFFASSDSDQSFPGEGFHPDLNSFELRTGADRSMLTIVDKEWNPEPHQDAQQSVAPEPRR